MKILIVEDDEDSATFLAEGIAARGHEASVARNGSDGLLMATGEARYEVVVVDRMLPGLDGLGLVKAMRAAGVSTPVLFLTNLSGIDDRVEGLEAGGDDYLVKPFAFTELMARLTALARRRCSAPNRRFSMSSISRWISFGAPFDETVSRSICSRANFNSWNF